MLSQAFLILAVSSFSLLALAATDALEERGTLVFSL
jgi:hypothetical protein